MRNRIGRPRFMQSFASSGGTPFAGGIGEAPTDGDVYGRQNGQWVDVVEEAPSDGTIYGRQNEAWVSITAGGGAATSAALVSFNPSGNIQSTNVQAALQEIDDEKISRTGDTMMGHLGLPINPGATNAVRKDYVDAATGANAAQVALKVDRAGDVMTGHLGLPTGPSMSQAVRRDYVDTADAVNATLANTKVAKAGDMMTGNLGITSSSANITLNVPNAPDSPSFTFNRSGLTRWLNYVSAGPDAVGNTGSEWVLARCDNAGNYIDAVLNFNRGDGRGYVIADPISALGIATKRYVDNATAGAFVLKAGDTMTGDLTVPGFKVDSAGPQITLSVSSVSKWTFGYGAGTGGNYFGIYSWEGSVAALYISTAGVVTASNNFVAAAGGDGGCAFGGAISRGILYDGTTLGLRGKATNALYFQSESGTFTYATLGPTGLNIAGALVAQAATITHDVHIYRSDAPTTALIYFGNTGSKYLYFDGGNWVFHNGGILADGSMAITGSISTLTDLYCNGNLQVGKTQTWGTIFLGNSGARYIQLNGDADTVIFGGAAYYQFSSHVQINGSELRVGASGSSGVVRFGSGGGAYLLFDGSNTTISGGYLWMVQGVGLGGTTPAGMASDGVNVLVRSMNGASPIYFQSYSGGAHYGYFANGSGKMFGTWGIESSGGYDLRMLYPAVRDWGVAVDGSGNLKFDDVSGGHAVATINITYNAWYMPYNATTTNGVNGSFTSGYLLQSTSSMKYKKDIKPLVKSQADKLMRLKPITFKSNTELCPLDDPNHVQLGFIAEDVAKVLPELVMWDYDKDDYESIQDNIKSSIQTKLRDGAKRKPNGLSYERISVLAVYKIKEQENRINELTQRLDAMSKH